MVSLEFNGLGADEIKRRPEVEVLLVTRDNRTEVMRKVLDWLMEGVN
jgi:nucleoside-triphosphatase THEP1